MTDEKKALELREAEIDPQFQRPGYHRIDDYGAGVEGGENRFDWARWTSAILRRKWMIIAFVAIGVGGAVITAFRMRDTYQAFTVIYVGKEDTSVVKASAGDLIQQNDDSLKTKMYLLQSNPLIEDVIVDMKLDRSEDGLNTGWRTLPEAFKAMGESARSLFQSEGKNISTDTPRDSLDSLVAQPAPERQYSPAESWRLEPFVASLKGKLTVENILDDTQLLKISYKDANPVIAAAVCNQLAQTLIARNIENKSEKFKEASNWLDRSTGELKARAERAEQALANYTRGHHDIAPQGKGSLTLDRLLRLQGEVTRAETDRIIKESIYNDVRQGRVEHVPTAYSDANLTELQKKLGDLMTRAAQIEVNYGPDNPQTIEVQQQIASIRKQIDSQRKSMEARLKFDYDRAVRDERAFKQALEDAKNEGAQENVDTVQYGILQQEVETTKAIYKSFLEKSSEANFELAQQRNNLRVVEPALTPRTTKGPNRKLLVVSGFALSLAFAVCLALMLEFFDRTVRSADDLSRRLQLPALAVIPTIGAKAKASLVDRFKDMLKPVIVGGLEFVYNAPLFDRLKARLKLPAGLASLNAPAYAVANRVSEAASALPGKTQIITIGDRSPAAEAYRLLRTSITLSENSGDFKAKTWLITSSKPAEGKSTTIINVSISMARAGRSVLIVDCDLRLPTVHEKLHVSQKPGLSSYLSGDAELNDVIQRLDIPGLSLITSGPVPNNPCELIGSPKMKEMMVELARRYDYVMVDSPPLINLADSLILSTIVDSVVLVVNGGKSDLEAASQARQELSGVGANVFGVVLNEGAVKRVPYYGYYAEGVRQRF
ncbi:MAG: polysaccharide biosynthesis tyrosine autokinase [Chloracidobacterium sp.]|nr:polysaccharide biosynthesis tyrosine autokinase [Chloracidobacterium sp.]